MVKCGVLEQTKLLRLNSLPQLPYWVKKISKGRYTLYCIPQPDQWTLIINKDLNSWGAFSYKQANDLMRVPLPVKKGVAPALEFFTMFFNENNHLIIGWDDVRVVVPVELYYYLSKLRYHKFLF